MRILMLLSLVLVFAGCESDNNQQAEQEDNSITSETMTAPEVADEPIAIEATPMLKIGDTAPDFELVGTDGKTYSLAGMDADTKGYVVTFTCNTCPYAVKYEDRIIDLHNTLAPMGYPVVAIQPNDVSIKPGDNMEAMMDRVKTKNIPYAYLLDAEQSVYPAYGASRTPEIFLLDKDRVLRYHGAIDDDVEGTDVSINYVKEAVAALEAGKEIDPAHVKAIGCSIKAK